MKKWVCAINSNFTEFQNVRERESQRCQMMNSCLLADEDDENTQMEWETNNSRKHQLKA